MTKQYDSAPWLKLVYDSSDVPHLVQRQDVDDRQLRLPLPEPDVVVVLDVAHLHYSSFKRALNHVQPKWIFDIRVAPRMDNFAGGRAHAFREFNRIGTHYIDLFGLLGVSNYKTVASNPMFWTPVIEEVLQSRRESKGPYMALLDDDLMINTISRQFAASISHVTGRDVSLSKVDTFDTEHEL